MPPPDVFPAPLRDALLLHRDLRVDSVRPRREVRESDEQLADAPLVHRHLPHCGRLRVLLRQLFELSVRRQLAGARLHFTNRHVALFLGDHLLAQQPLTSIGSHRHQVEADLAARVLLDALHDERPDHVEPVVLGGVAEADRPRLESIKLVQLAIDGKIRDEVVHLVVVLGRPPLLLDERLWPCERVVHLAQQVGVGDGEALEIRRKILGERLEGGELFTQFERRPVEKDGEDGLRGARIGDHLRREEDLVVIVRDCWSVILLLPPPKEEYQPVHWQHRLHRLLVE
mmetsp:Transcript_48362/g.111980  ORF Transcript_48362/g.111980 Transcript_48362/m.111980 type:complete len:286 (-) Transcript_48362:117-974(-)